MINSLTEEQTKRLNEYKENYLKIGLCTDPADFATAEEAIKQLYKVQFNNEDVPTFFHCESPYAAEKLINEHNHTENYNGTYEWGQMDAYWIALYLFAREIGVVYKEADNTRLDLYDQICKSICWWYPYKNAAFLCNRPDEIHMEEGQLHCVTGPAIRFRDGYSLWALHGVRVPQWIVETDPKTWTKDQLLNVKNAEVRREMIRKIGIDMFVQRVGAIVIDKQDDYELLNVDLGDGQAFRPYLKMKNPSIGTWHVEGVAPECRTVADALKWRNHGIEATPEVLS